MRIDRHFTQHDMRVRESRRTLYNLLSDVWQTRVHRESAGPGHYSLIVSPDMAQRIMDALGIGEEEA